MVDQLVQLEANPEVKSHSQQCCYNCHSAHSPTALPLWPAGSGAAAPPSWPCLIPEEICIPAARGVGGRTASDAGSHTSHRLQAWRPRIVHRHADTGLSNNANAANAANAGSHVGDRSGI